MAFFAKKLLSSLLMPLPLALLLLVAGAWWSRVESTRIRGQRALIAGLVVLYVASLPVVSWLLLAPLERGMDGYQARGHTVGAIVVLGAGYHPVAGRPLTGVISGASSTRVAEAVRIARLHPQALVHCSGWGGQWGGSNAAAACELAVGLGVAATRIVLHADARDTEEEAAAVAGSRPPGAIVLVTHAAHMPRARALFERYGLRVTPAPTGHVSPAAPNWTPIPSSSALGTTTGAWREWLGRLWVALKG